MSDAAASDQPELDQYHQRLRVAEYEAVRAEWLSSRTAQQNTLQWTLAALAVLIAGTLNSSVRTHQPTLYVAFAAAVVIVAMCSHAIWFGEVMRMERAALFLRGVERELHQSRDTPAPLRWETWRGVSKTERTDAWIAKAAPSIIAGFALYGIIALAGLVILIVATSDRQIPISDQHLAEAMAISTGVIYAAVAAYLCVSAWRIRKESSKAADLRLVSPRDTTSVR